MLKEIFMIADSMTLDHLLSTGGPIGVTKLYKESFVLMIMSKQPKTRTEEELYAEKWETIDPNLKIFNARRMKMKKEGKENIAQEFKALQN
uniref:Uncharacterized protein n=1 Tax=Solanum lycopersicum TaxID=4081 RepID=A0A3Q7G3U5_SOLLC